MRRISGRGTRCGLVRIAASGGPPDASYGRKRGPSPLDRRMHASRRKLFRTSIGAAIGLCLALVLSEFALRFVLFHGGDSSLARKLRRADYFADGDSDDDYWKLRWLFAPREARAACHGWDPVLGWAGSYVRPDTYEHVRAQPHAEREGRLVLLYGDSFSQCATPEEQCFPGLLGRSDLATRYRMLNYGVGGYGLDQIALMIQRSIDRYRAENPIVIVGMLVDNDLDRSVLSVRDWPKPRLDVRGDELVLREPVAPSFDTYLERHPLEVRSYFARLVAHRSRWLPQSWRDVLGARNPRIAEKEALNRAILATIHRELASRELEHFFLLFHSQWTLVPPGADDWEEQLVRSTCADLGARVVSVRPYLLAAAGGDPGAAARFYLQGGRGVGHLTPLGNAITFEAMRDGIECREECAGVPGLPAKMVRGELERLVQTPHVQFVMGRAARVHSDGADVYVRESDARTPPFDRWDDRRRICIRPGAESPTCVTFERMDGEHRFSARVRATVYPAAAAVGTVLVQVVCDAHVVYREEIAVEHAWRPLAVELDGTRELSISVARTPSTPASLWLCLGDPVFE